MLPGGCPRRLAALGHQYCRSAPKPAENSGPQTTQISQMTQIGGQVLKWATLHWSQQVGWCPVHRRAMVHLRHL